MAVMVGKLPHCLLDLLWRREAGELDVEIPLVISNHDALREPVEHAGIPFLHLPVQSGSDKVLRAMRRKYTASAYLEKVAMLREAVPGLALAADIIVGFPGETEEDFLATLELVRRVGYQQLYHFIYSPRPHTTAAEAPPGEEVPRAVASSRLQRLIQVQGEIQTRVLERYVGRKLEVLVEGESAKGGGQLTGRSPHQAVVNFTPREGLPGPRPGEYVPVRIREARFTSLLGEDAREG